VSVDAGVQVALNAAAAVGTSLIGTTVNVNANVASQTPANAASPLRTRLLLSRSRSRGYGGLHLFARSHAGG
jgi:hypothetical protein